MKDWKDALSALTGIERPQAEVAATTSVQKKKRVGVVYSTNASYDYAEEPTPTIDTLPPKQQRLRVQMERAGRAGKTVTLVRGFVGQTDNLTSLCRMLKQKCGVGGSVKDGEIVMQGDLRAKLVEVLKKEGYMQTK